MRPTGIAAVDAAKADGRWERAYAGPATITVPDDLAAALAKEPAAAAFFESLNKSDRYAVLWRVETATPTSRAKRLEGLVQMLAVGKKPGEPAKSVSKKTKNVNKSGAENIENVKRVKKTDVLDQGRSQQPRRSGLRSRPSAV
jgi:hypothetical protein